MNFLDYDLLATLTTVIREGSFEAAAARLNVSQSAISQRIKLLEGKVGSTLVIRGRPCIGTPMGNQLCAHAERVAFLEHDLAKLCPTISGVQPVSRTTLPIAVNADSIATWFPEVVAEATNRLDLLLELIPDDQEHTFETLTSGRAIAAVCGDVPEINGFNKKFLGYLNYTSVCSREYWDHHFLQGVNRNSLLKSTCLVFDRKDTIPDQWLSLFDLSRNDLSINWVPSFTGYIKSVLTGAGWGIVPRISVVEEIEKGHLIEMAPTEITPVPLFWMSSTNLGASMKCFSQLLISHARKNLVHL